MSSTPIPNIYQKALQAKIKRLEFEQLCLERQIKNLEKEVEEQLSNNDTTNHLDKSR